MAIMNIITHSAIGMHISKTDPFWEELHHYSREFKRSDAVNLVEDLLETPVRMKVCNVIRHFICEGMDPEWYE